MQKAALCTGGQGVVVSLRLYIYNTVAPVKFLYGHFRNFRLPVLVGSWWPGRFFLGKMRRVGIVAGFMVWVCLLYAVSGSALLDSLSPVVTGFAPDSKAETGTLTDDVSQFFLINN